MIEITQPQFDVLTIGIPIMLIVEATDEIQPADYTDFSCNGEVLRCAIHQVIKHHNILYPKYIVVLAQKPKE